MSGYGMKLIKAPSRCKIRGGPRSTQWIHFTFPYAKNEISTCRLFCFDHKESSFCLEYFRVTGQFWWQYIWTLIKTTYGHEHGKDKHLGYKMGAIVKTYFPFRSTALIFHISHTSFVTQHPFHHTGRPGSNVMGVWFWWLSSIQTWT